MDLSKQSIETLTDLVEIKLSCMQVFDREDAREMAILEQCRRELGKLSEGTEAGSVVPFARAQRRRRGPKSLANA